MTPPAIEGPEEFAVLSGDDWLDFTGCLAAGDGLISGGIQRNPGAP